MHVRPKVPSNDVNGHSTCTYMPAADCANSPPHAVLIARPRPANNEAKRTLHPSPQRIIPALSVAPSPGASWKTSSLYGTDTKRFESNGALRSADRSWRDGVRPLMRSTGVLGRKTNWNQSTGRSNTSAAT
jgi:hypothetical protein